MKQKKTALLKPTALALAMAALFASAARPARPT